MQAVGCRGRGRQLQAMYLVVASGAAVASPAVAQLTTRVAADASGAFSDGEYMADRDCVSSDGRWLAFARVNTAGAHVYLRDLRRGHTELVSRSMSGSATSGSAPAISADGRYVAFHSAAADIVPGDSNQAYDVFVYDRELGDLRLISSDSSGQHVLGSSYLVTISGDASTVAFWSDSSQLVPGDTNNAPDIFVKDVTTGAIEIATVSTAGLQGWDPCMSTNCGRTYSPDLSFDGSVIAFTTRLAGLHAADTNATQDIFRRDRTAGVTQLVSMSISGGSSASRSILASLSADGRFVGYQGWGDDLVAGDSNGAADSFIYDSHTNATQVVSVAWNTGVAAGGLAPTLSPSGEWAAFASSAGTILPGDVPGFMDIFVLHTPSGLVRRVSTGVGGAPSQDVNLMDGNGPAVLDDGRVYYCVAGFDMFVGGDPTPMALSVLLHDFSLPSTAILGYCTAKTNSVGCEPRITVCGVPAVAYGTLCSVAALDVKSHEPGMFIWSTASQVVPFGGGTLCVAAPIRRTPLRDSGGTSALSDCSGVYAFNLSRPFLQRNGLLPGTTIHGQFYSRDSGYGAPHNVGLTDGAQLTVLP